MGPTYPRNSTRTRKSHPPKRSRRKSGLPTPSQPPAASRTARSDSVPASALQGIHRKLEIAGAVAYICASLLIEQAGEEQDVGLVLRRCVGDEIDRQMEELDRLLGRERTFASDEAEGGDV